MGPVGLLGRAWHEQALGQDAGHLLGLGDHLRDLGLGMQYLNRQRRWNWGAVGELQPSIRVLPHQQLLEHEGQNAISLETRYFEQMQLRVAGLVAYPLNQAQRLEFSGGVRRITYRQTVQSAVRSLENGRLLDESTTTGFGGAPA